MCKTSYSVESDVDRAKEILAEALLSNDEDTVWELADFLHDTNLLQKVATEKSVKENIQVGRSFGISDAISAFAEVMRNHDMYDAELVDEFRSALLRESPSRSRELYLEDRGIK